MKWAQQVMIMIIIFVVVIGGVFLLHGSLGET